MDKKKIVLVDGNSYLHRAFHALPRLTDANGNVINAVYGFLRMLKKTINMHDPTHVLVAFDHKKPTFRHRDYKDYKAHREETDKDLIGQFEKVYTVLEALKIRYMSSEGYEADDILATFARKASEKNIPVLVVTGDKDILQIVRKNVKVSNGIRDIIYDKGGVKNHLGIDPAQVTDYLALVGDKSDNLPGIRGIGPVTARKLLEKYKDLEGIYSHIDEVKPSVKKKLEKYRDDAYISKRLAGLIDDIDLPLEIDDCCWVGPDTGKLKEEFRKLSFDKLISDWVDDGEKKNNLKTEVISAGSELSGFLKGAKAKERLGVEVVYESDKGFSIGKEVVGLALSFDGENVCYIPVNHSYLGVSSQPEWGEIKKIINKYANKAKPGILAYDIKDVYKFLKTEEIKPVNYSFDIKTAAYAVSSSSTSYNLADIADSFLGWKPGGYGEKPWELDFEKAAETAGKRLAALFELEKILRRRIKEEDVEDLYFNIELPLSRVLAEMELTGIRVERNELKKTEGRFKKELRKLEDEIFSCAGEKFNVNSSKQLSVILFDKIGLNPVRKTKTGYSTAEDVLVKLSRKHPLPDKILRYRRLQKLLSTYIKPLPELISPQTGRLHTSFNITTTATGRLSSTEPNLQNIPVKTFEGCLIRKTFVPDEKNIFISADYSQIDLRVLAHISKDKDLVKSFCNEQDIHARTATRIFDVAEDKVSEEMRKKAKAINFGIVYGMSSWGLAQRVDMDERESSEFIKKYFKRYTGVSSYMENAVSGAREKGYVKTIFGRRRYIPEINSRNSARRKFSERIAVNTPIQGSAADIIKKAMIELLKRFNLNEGEVKMLLQIHDELLFEVPAGNADEVIGEVKEIMENSVRLSVPLTVDFKKGENWRDLEKC